MCTSENCTTEIRRSQGPSVYGCWGRMIKVGEVVEDYITAQPDYVKKFPREKIYFWVLIWIYFITLLF